MDAEEEQGVSSWFSSYVWNHRKGTERMAIPAISLMEAYM